MDFRDWERWLAKFWEGIFQTKRERPVQPVEIARALIREMSLQRRVSISHVYVPNVFTISLGKVDFEKITPLQEPFSRELEEYLQGKAGEKGFTLIGRPCISFIEDPSLGIGEIRIKPVFAPTETEPDGALLKKTLDHTMIFDKKDLEDGEGKDLFVVVVQGPDQGKRFPLKRNSRYLVGRKSTNQVVLSDPNASREHALLEWREDGLYIIDLQSRNGTFVNGNRVEQQLLLVGDHIQIGENLLQVEGG